MASASPLLRPGTPPCHIADRIIRARKGNPPQLQFSEMSQGDISETIRLLVAANGLTDAFLLNAIDHRIRGLVLTSCYHIRKYSLGMIPGQCNALESIDLSNCRQVDNKLVANLLQGSQLNELILDGCVRVTDAAFACMPPARLKTLSLAGCRQISEEALLKIALTCTELEDLNLAGCRSSVSSAVLEAFLDNCKHLRKLNVSDCAVLSSDEAFCQYQYKTNLSNSFLALESIKLAGLSGMPPRYSHRTVSAVASMCGPNLVELDTTWCAGINDEACFAIAIHCPSMKRLFLCNSSVTVYGVELLVSHLARLESLDLSWCLKVGSQAVQAIALNARNLLSINLSHCVDFLDVTGAAIKPLDVASLVQGSLTRLELGGLSRLGTQDLLDAIATCSTLTHLSLSLAVPLDSLASLSSLTHLSLDISRGAPIVSWPKYYFPNLIKLSLIGNPANPNCDQLLESILATQRRLEHLELRNAQSLSSNLFESWIKGYSPDREVTLLVDAMLERELAGYVSAATVFGRSMASDSEAGTVVFRGAKLVKRKDPSETDTNLGISELVKSSIVLSDAARGMDNLRTLILTGSSNLTDESLDWLSLMATYMQDLSILDAPFATEAGAEPIRRRCRLLRSLELTGPKLRVRIDSSKFFNRRHRRKGQVLPPQKPIFSDDD